MWSLDDDGPVPLWRTARGDARPLLAFTTRHGGVSEAPYDTLNLGRSTADRPAAIEDNRRRVLDTLDLDPSRLATAGQVHGAAIAEVRSPGHHPDVDALWTRVPGLAVAVTTADCVPVLLESPGVVCAVHAGWRGTAAGLPGAAVRATLDASGFGADQLIAHVGPSIRVCCYDVGADVADRFPAEARQRAGDGWRLDLVTAIRLQLHDAGVPDARIRVVSACTACDTAYFSHRRDVGLTGRHWAIAALPRHRGASSGAEV